MSKAEIIPVKLNGKEYPSYIDDHGVQRFVPNPIVKRMIDKTMKSSGQLKNGVYNLNDVAMDYYSDPDWASTEDMLDFYTQINYSVSGMVDLSYFEDVVVENPLWED